jgi:membrane protease YdiL (CAAX protease family)
VHSPSVDRSTSKLWRFLRFPLTRMLIAFSAIGLFAALVFVAAALMHLHGLAAAGIQLLVGLGAWAIYLGYVRLLERRSATELSLPDMPRQSAKGFLIGAALFATTVGILWLCGVYSVQGVAAPDVMLAPFVGALGAALLEELAIRGVLFRIIEESLGTWIALGLTALVFGLLHGFNPGASWNSTAAIALESGILLAAAYVYARSLWLCIGLHCAWNFTEGGVFGASVSGGKGHGLLIAQFQGPAWLSGGQFGPEASLVAVLVCLPLAIVFLLLARRRGHIMAPFWKRT